MHLSSLLLCLSVGTLVKCVSGSDWCYTGCEHTPSHWGDISAFCGGNRQSPIDIVTSQVKTDLHLHNFTFVNFSQHVIKSVTNNGHTIKFILEENATEVSGGGLNAEYTPIQFHFHWGDTEHHPGSEHTIDGHRYPMEMHIVSLKKGLSVQQAVEDSQGIAVLGFLINATEDGDMSGPWSVLTSYLTDVTGTDVKINHSISISDLIENVNLTKFYRYMGSLTTPKCNEAVVWTVFQEPISINKNLTQLFPTKAGFTNVYRPTQQLHGRQVFASPGITLPPSHSWCYDDHCLFKPSQWHLLPNSHCDGERQSPINIETQKAVRDDKLDGFNFKMFDKHPLDYLTNTGHAVKGVLKNGALEISGGGLGYVYSTLQFHFHWGTASGSSNGSEHTVDSKRYPMEMHIVNKRKDLTLDEAVKTPNGLAVLGFFIEGQSTKNNIKSKGSSKHSVTNPTPASDILMKLTQYLPAIQKIGSKVNITERIVIDDFVANMGRGSYYRYNGSLTTPSCNEAVVWTVFEESIKVEKNLMEKFPTHTGYDNVFRPVQSVNNRNVTKSASSAPDTIILLLLLACLCALSYNWHW